MYQVEVEIDCSGESNVAVVVFDAFRAKYASSYAPKAVAYITSNFDSVINCQLYMDLWILWIHGFMLYVDLIT